MTAFYVITRGESASWTVSVKNPDKTTPDLTGAKLWFTVKCRIEDVELLMSKRTPAAGGGSDQFEILNQSDPLLKGKARFKFVPADTANMKPGTYWCDGFYEDALGNRKQIIADQEFVIEPAVTTNFSTT